MVGADADIVIWDPHRKVTLTQDLMQHGSDYTPYEGIGVTGWPVKPLLRGALVVDDGRIVGAPGTVPAAPDVSELVNASAGYIGRGGECGEYLPKKALPAGRTSVRVSRPRSDGAKRKNGTAANSARASAESGMSMTSSK